MANEHNQSIYHDVSAALVSATYNHKTFKTSEYGRFLQNVRFCSLKNKQKKKFNSHMTWDECLSVALSNSNQGDLNTNDAAALQKFFPLK